MPDPAPRHGDLLALYGTLRFGEPSFAALKLAESLERLGACTLKGALCDLGPYPGFVPGAGRVAGDLFKVRDPAVFVRLDAHETYDPHDESASEYLRRRLDLLEPAGRAWIYVYNRPTAALAPIPGGDWLAR